MRTIKLPSSGPVLNPRPRYLWRNLSYIVLHTNHSGTQPMNLRFSIILRNVSRFLFDRQVKNLLSRIKELLNLFQHHLTRWGPKIQVEKTNILTSSKQASIGDKSTLNELGKLDDWQICTSNSRGIHLTIRTSRSKLTPHEIIWDLECKWYQAMALMTSMIGWSAHSPISDVYLHFLAFVQRNFGWIECCHERHPRFWFNGYHGSIPVISKSISHESWDSCGITYMTAQWSTSQTAAAYLNFE